MAAHSAKLLSVEEALAARLPSSQAGVALPPQLLLPPRAPLLLPWRWASEAPLLSLHAWRRVD